MMDQRVSMITLGVADLERAGAFYSALGWQKAAESQPGITFYQCPGMVLGLFPLDELAKDQGRPGAHLGSGAMNIAQNQPDRQAVDAVFEQAIGAGATSMKPPQEVFWGGYSGYFADPDGHAWEIAHNPFFPLARDGTLTLPSEIDREIET
ncbi:MAG: VOC family protein [Paracoccaceae bacterium]